ncbi:hypothetical protein [Paenibacillus silvae]|nr:hypothetical protein [Paenibacillus silvae]
MTVVLMQFLADHELITIEPFQEDGSLKEGLIVVEIFRRRSCC